MNTGSLNKFAEIQSIGTTTNDFGEIEQGQFTKFKDVYCSITPINGKESFLSNTDFSTVSHKIRIRYTSGINASQRLVFRGRIFEFIYLRDIEEQNKEIEILAKEKING